MRGNKFRNLKRFLGGYFALLVVMICAVIGLHSCDKVNAVCSSNGVDSVYVTECIKATANPTFTSLTEVKVAQKQLAEKYSVDEVFLNMPDNILNNVVNVCLNKNTVITKTDIVNEYRANKDVYDNLDSQPTSANNNTVKKDTVKEGQRKPTAGKVSYRYEMDTVEGTPKRVLVKEERVYE